MKRAEDQIINYNLIKYLLNFYSAMNQKQKINRAKHTHTHIKKTIDQIIAVINFVKTTIKIKIKKEEKDKKFFEIIDKN